MCLCEATNTTNTNQMEWIAEGHSEVDTGQEGQMTATLKQEQLRNTHFAAVPQQHFQFQFFRSNSWSKNKKKNARKDDMPNHCNNIYHTSKYQRQHTCQLAAEQRKQASINSWQISMCELVYIQILERL